MTVAPGTSCEPFESLSNCQQKGKYFCSKDGAEQKLHTGLPLPELNGMTASLSFSQDPTHPTFAKLSFSPSPHILPLHSPLVVRLPSLPTPTPASLTLPLRQRRSCLPP